MATIHLLKGDITAAAVDVIVNAANPIMLGGGGVDGAIHRAAGPALQEACREIKPYRGMRCPPGEARITQAGNLPANYVIHTVGPKYFIDPEPEQLLASAYRNSLDLALVNDCRHIAFPAISCGAYGYPADEAAAIAVQVCLEAPYQGLTIDFYLFTDSLLSTWQAALDAASAGSVE